MMFKEHQLRTVRDAPMVILMDGPIREIVSRLMVHSGAMVTAMDMATIRLLQLCPIIAHSTLATQIRIDTDVEIPMQMVGLIRTQPQFSRPSHGMFLMVRMLSNLIRLNGRTMTSMDMVIIGIISTGMLVEQRPVLEYSMKALLSLMLVH